MRVGGIVLCGGVSARMGAPKAWLPFGGELMLTRVVRLLREAVGPVVVVAAPGQDVPPLPDDVEIARDEVGGRGPLGGLAAGLAALVGRVDAVYLSACDVPLLRPEFVRRVVGCLERPNPPTPFPKKEGGYDLSAALSPSPPGGGVGEGSSIAAVPRVNDRLHPLAAAYRVAVLPTVREMLVRDQRRMTDLLALVPTSFIGPVEFAGVDPELASLRNVNTPEEYAAVLRELDPPRPG